MSKVSESKHKDKNLLFLPDAEFMLLAEQYINVFHPQSIKNNPKASFLPIPAVASTKHSIISAIAAPNKSLLKARIQLDVNKLSRAKYPSTTLIYLFFSNNTLSDKDLLQLNSSSIQNGYSITVISLDMIFNELFDANQIPVLTDEKDLAKYYNDLFSTPNILPNILDEIFNYVNKKSPTTISAKSFESSLMHLNDKIRANFISTLYKEVIRQYDIYWEDKTLVDHYIHSNYEQYESQLYKVLDTIRTGFQKHDLNITNSVEATIQEPTIFQDLSELLLKPENRSDPRYQKVAFVLVLFFFEYCDFGKKSSEDPQTLFPKNDKDYDSPN